MVLILGWTYHVRINPRVYLLYPSLEVLLLTLHSIGILRTFDRGEDSQHPRCSPSITFKADKLPSSGVRIITHL